MSNDEGDNNKELQKSRRLRKRRIVKRWEQTAHQQGQKWNAVFQEKVRNFSDKWTVHLAVDPPTDQLKGEPLHWEEPMQERLSMAFKCKECGFVWISDDGLVYIYFRRNQLINIGEVLIWLQGQACSQCCSSETPAMDVYRDEMNAVLSYLQLEIGWYYYNLQYTLNEEHVIENGRMKREKSAKKGKERVPERLTNIRNAVLKPQSQPERRSNENSGDGNQPEENSLNKRQQEPQLSTNPLIADPQPVKKINPPRKIVQSKNRITKLKTRWDHSPEEIDAKWDGIFQSKFEKFVNHANPDDKWIIRLEKVTKKHPLRREKKWHRFLGEKVEAGFNCRKCGYVWESMRGWVTFWIYQNEPIAGKLTGGLVTAHILGQKCQNCSGDARNQDDYETGDLQGDEIEAVLDFLLMDIDYWFYKNEAYTYEDEERISDKRKTQNIRPFSGVRTKTHQKSFCQACREKVCTKTMEAVYPNFPNPSS